MKIFDTGTVYINDYQMFLYKRFFQMITTKEITLQVFLTSKSLEYTKKLILTCVSPADVSYVAAYLSGYFMQRTQDHNANFDLFILLPKVVTKRKIPNSLGVHAFEV